jgi:hypothetical protein
MVDFTQGRILMIEGISKSFNPVLSFETIAEINTLGGLYDFVSCTETGKIYKYVALGSAYTVDNDNVLATADGGGTRFVNTSLFENYTPITNTTVERSFISTSFDLVANTPLQINHPFANNLIDISIIYNNEEVGLSVIRNNGNIIVESNVTMNGCLVKITG